MNMSVIKFAHRKRMYRIYPSTRTHSLIITFVLNLNNSAFLSTDVSYNY